MEIDAAMNSNRASINTSGSTSFKPQQYKTKHGGHNNDNRFRPSSSSSYHGSSNNRYPPSNRFEQQRPSLSYNRPQQHQQSYGQQSNRGYTPMDTSNAITQQRRQPPPHTDSRSSDRKPITGNCYNCGKTGHFIRDCPSNKSQANRQRTNVIVQEESSAQDDTVLIINEINNTQVQRPHKKLITFMGLVNNQPAYVLIDSGATNNYISESFVAKHKYIQSP